MFVSRMFDVKCVNIYVPFIEDFVVILERSRLCSLYKTGTNLHQELKLKMLGGRQVLFIIIRTKERTTVDSFLIGVSVAGRKLGS